MIVNTISVIDAISKDKLPEKEIRTFTNYVTTAMRDIYNHATISQPYFDRIGSHLEPDTVDFLDDMLNEVKKPFVFKDGGIETLDLGCGNGRHLLHLAESPQFILTGLDSMQLSKEVCESYEAAGKLPKGTFIKGDIRSLPFKDERFDFIFANASLFHIPYFPNSSHGLNEVLTETLRVLKPKGFLYISARHGNGYEPFPFFQLHNEGSVRQLAHTHGLQVKWFKPFHVKDSVECIPKTLFNDWFQALLYKP